MRFEDLNWMDVESYLKKDDRLILVTGACEQHGYLSLLTDVKIPMALADAAARQTGVLIAPPLNYGCSPYFLAYPGTLSLRLSTMMEAVEDIVRSAYGQGFRRLLILNGHGGNNGLKLRLTELANALPALQVRWYSWWTSHSVEAIARLHEIKPDHANWLEAFPFTVLGELPEIEKAPPYVPSEVMDAATARRVYGDGTFGGKYQVSPRIMDDIFSACLADVLQILAWE